MCKPGLKKKASFFFTLTGEKLETFETIEAGQLDTPGGYPVIDRVSKETVAKMPAGARHYVRLKSEVLLI